MKNYYVKIIVSDEAIKENPFITKDGEALFYRYVCDLFGVSYDNIKSIDCCKVNVASNIQDAWYNYANENNMDSVGLTMMLAISGPKALKELDDNTIELEEGAIEY